MKVYRFEPNGTITPEELAHIMKAMIVSLIQSIKQQPPTGNEPLDIDVSIYSHLDPAMQRFFTEVDDIDS